MDGWGSGSWPSERPRARVAASEGQLAARRQPVHVRHPSSSREAPAIERELLGSDDLLPPHKNTSPDETPAPVDVFLCGGRPLVLVKATEPQPHTLGLVAFEHCGPRQSLAVEQLKVLHVVVGFQEFDLLVLDALQPALLLHLLLDFQALRTSHPCEKAVARV